MVNKKLIEELNSIVKRLENISKSMFNDDDFEEGQDIMTISQLLKERIEKY